MVCVCGPHTSVEDPDRTRSQVSVNKIGFSWSPLSTASAPPGLLGLKTAGSHGSSWTHQPLSPLEPIPPKPLSNHTSFDFVSLESPDGYSPQGLTTCHVFSQQRSVGQTGPSLKSLQRIWKDKANLRAMGTCASKPGSVTGR